MQQRFLHTPRTLITASLRITRRPFIHCTNDLHERNYSVHNAAMRFAFKEILLGISRGNVNKILLSLIPLIFFSSLFVFHFKHFLSTNFSPEKKRKEERHVSPLLFFPAKQTIFVYFELTRHLINPEYKIGRNNIRATNVSVMSRQKEYPI